MSLADGFHQIAEKGNVQHDRLWTIENIDSARTYYWSVQTIDNSFLGSAFAPEQIVQPKLIIDSSFVEVDFGLQALAASDAEWGDIDGDNDLDFAITGGAANQGFTHIYRNDNIGGLRSFTQVGGNLMAVHSGALAWADFDNDNDGDLDFAVSGARADEIPTPQDAQPFTSIYRNDIATGGGINQIAAGLKQLYRCALDWGDYDADGDLDLLITGFDGRQYHTRIYRNDGNDDFQEVDAQLEAVIKGAVEWGDYNNDGRLDILLTGQNSATLPVTEIYENIRQESNNAPSPAASGFSANKQGNSVTFSWDAGSDPQTPAAILILSSWERMTFQATLSYIATTVVPLCKSPPDCRH